MSDTGGLSFHHLLSLYDINEGGNKKETSTITTTTTTSCFPCGGGGGGGVLPKVDAGAWGLRSPCYGDSYGLCTESLGSESSFDESVGEGDDEMVSPSSSSSSFKSSNAALPSPKREEEGRKGKGRDFPPPLSSLELHGGATRRRCFMKAVREDGRLILTPQFLADTPQTFHACRRDGRLQLQFAQLHRDQVEEEEGEGEGEEEEAAAAAVVEESRKGQVEHVVVEEEKNEEEIMEVVGGEVKQKPPWQWVAHANLEGYCCNTRCHDVPTRGEGGGSTPGQFPLFWRNPPFMTTA